MAKRAAFTIDLNETFPHLPGAPIVEAVIHWQVPAEQFPDEAELRRELGGALPEYPTCQRQHELRVEAEVSDEGHRTSSQRGWRGLRLTSTDGGYVVQFQRRGLVCSRLAPYPDWESFSTEARRVWQVFQTVARPTEVERLGVRFINRIPLARPGEMRRFLKHPPKHLEPLGLAFGELLCRTVSDIPGQPFQLSIIQALQPPSAVEDESTALLLDLDVWTIQPVPLDEMQMDDFLRRMRWIKDKAFFELLKPKAMLAFQGAPT